MSSDNGSFFAPNYAPTLADSVSVRSKLSGAQQTPRNKRHHRLHRVQGFTYLLATQKEKTVADIYGRSLLLQGHGMPLWCPYGDVPRSAEHIINGVSIGDVGIIDDDGNFEFMFNIFRAPDDPIHRGGTPREFQPISPPLDSSEVTFIPDYFKPGAFVVSDGVRVKRHATDPLKFNLYCKAQEGAVLHLPNGASREDLVSTDRLHQYIQHNSAHWYQKLNGYMSGFYPNGCLMVVTGCDKASDWANAIFEEKGSLHYTWYEQFKSPWSGDGIGQCFRPFPEADCGLKMPVDVNSRHQCVFMRTIRISLSSDLWLSITRYAINSPFFCAVTIRQSLFQRLTDAVLVWLKMYYTEERGLNAFICRSMAQQVFHPNDILAQVLLEQFPNADTCLLADSMWSGCYRGGIGTDYNMFKLVDRILDSHRVIVQHGCLTLTPVKEKISRLHTLKKCLGELLGFRHGPRVSTLYANRVKYGLDGPEKARLPAYMYDPL